MAAGLRRLVLWGVALGTPWIGCSDTGSGGGLQPSQFTVRVSTDAQGREVDGASFSPSISEDGHFVAFASQAPTLTPQAADGVQDIFVKDRWTGAVHNVSYINPPVPPPPEGPIRGTCSAPAISGDGQTVAFLSVADIVAVPDSAPGVPWYPPGIHSTTNAFVYKVSSPKPLQGLGGYPSWPTADVTDLSLSRDGRFLAFATGDTNTIYHGGTPAPAGTIQIYVADLSSDRITTVSRSRTVASSGCNGVCSHPQISADGSQVVYESTATDLTADAVTLTQVYISAIDGSQTTLVSRDPTATGMIGPYNSWFPRVSGDGRYVCYLSNADSFAGWAGGWNQVVLMIRDMSLFTNTVVARNVYAQGRMAGVMSPPPVAQVSPMSTDGRFVAFKSRDSTLTSVPFSVPQIFVWDRQGGVLLVSTNTYTGAASALECFDAALSGDGSWAGWDTGANNLIQVDDNGASDVFVHGPNGP